MTVEELSGLVLDTLAKSGWAEVDGLGVFTRDREGRVQFHSGKAPRIFISYALEDLAVAEQLFLELQLLGFSPWLDRRKLMPGQNWTRRIEDAISNSDLFIACFSSQSVGKRGGFQAELRFALECARRIPLDDVFLIPARLDNCAVPARIQGETHYVDLFPDWESGIARIAAIVTKQTKRAE